MGTFLRVAPAGRRCASTERGVDLWCVGAAVLRSRPLRLPGAARPLLPSEQGAVVHQLEADIGASLGKEFEDRPSPVLILRQEQDILVE